MDITTYNGVIEVSTGNLLRFGYTDFENDGSYNSSTESLRTDVPHPGKIFGDSMYTVFHRWNGSEWVEIPD